MIEKIKKAAVYLYDLVLKERALFLILFFSFLLRVWGIYFDYPSGINFIWDEVYNLMHIFDIIETRDLFAAGSVYPTLLSLLYLPVFGLRVIYLALINGAYSIAGLKDLLIAGGMGQIYIIVRWYSVFFGVASTFLVYKISENIFKHKESAIYSTLAYTVSLIPVYLAHWGKVHIPMAFFLLLSLYLILNFEKTKKISYFYLSAIAAALSLSSHFFGMTAFIFLFVAFIQNREYISKITAVKAFLIFTFLTSFFYLSNYRGMIQYWRDNQVSLASNGYLGMASVSFWERLYYIPRDAYLLDPVLTVFALLAIILSVGYLSRNRSARYLFIGLITNFLLTVGIVSWPKMTRWLLTFVTLLVILGPGLIFEYLYDKGLAKKYINLIMAMILFPSLLLTIKWNSLLGSNTDILATNWLEDHAGAKEFIYTFDDVYMPLSYKAAKWNKEFNGMDTSKINYVIDQCEKRGHCDGGYNLIYDRARSRTKLPEGINFKYILSGIDTGAVDRRIEILLGTTSPKVAVQYYPTRDSDISKVGLSNEYLNAPESFDELLRLDMSGQFVSVYEVEKK